MVAEMLQDRLDDYVDVSVGDAKIIDPSFLVEERLDHLIIGDLISKVAPNSEIQNWLAKFLEISKRKKYHGIKTISGFYVMRDEIKIKPFWIEFLHDNVKNEIIYPPILQLKLNEGELALDNGAYDKVKEYSNEFIDILRSLWN